MTYPIKNISASETQAIQPQVTSSASTIQRQANPSQSLVESSPSLPSHFSLMSGKKKQRMELLYLHRVIDDRGNLLHPYSTYSFASLEQTTSSFFFDQIFQKFCIDVGNNSHEVTMAEFFRNSITQGYVLKRDHEDITIKGENARLIGSYLFYLLFIVEKNYIEKLFNSWGISHIYDETIFHFEDVLFPADIDIKTLLQSKQLPNEYLNLKDLIDLKNAIIESASYHVDGSTDENRSAQCEEIRLRAFEKLKPLDKGLVKYLVISFKGSPIEWILEGYFITPCAYDLEDLSLPFTDQLMQQASIPLTPKSSQDIGPQGFIDYILDLARLNQRRSCNETTWLRHISWSIKGKVSAKEGFEKEIFRITERSFIVEKEGQKDVTLLVNEVKKWIEHHHAQNPLAIFCFVFRACYFLHSQGYREEELRPFKELAGQVTTAPTSYLTHLFVHPRCSFSTFVSFVEVIAFLLKHQSLEHPYLHIEQDVYEWQVPIYKLKLERSFTLEFRCESPFPHLETLIQASIEGKKEWKQLEQFLESFLLTTFSEGRLSEISTPSNFVEIFEKLYHSPSPMLCTLGLLFLANSSLDSEKKARLFFSLLPKLQFLNCTHSLLKIVIEISKEILDHEEVIIFFETTSRLPSLHLWFDFFYQRRKSFYGDETLLRFCSWAFQGTNPPFKSTVKAFKDSLIIEPEFAINLLPFITRPYRRIQLLLLVADRFEKQQFELKTSHDLLVSHLGYMILSLPQQFLTKEKIFNSSVLSNCFLWYGKFLTSRGNRELAGKILEKMKLSLLPSAGSEETDLRNHIDFFATFDELINGALEKAEFNQLLKAKEWVLTAIKQKKLKNFEELEVLSILLKTSLKLHKVNTAIEIFELILRHTIDPSLKNSLTIRIVIDALFLSLENHPLLDLKFSILKLQVKQRLPELFSLLSEPSPELCSRILSCLYVEGLSLTIDQTWLNLGLSTFVDSPAPPSFYSLCIFLAKSQNFKENRLRDDLAETWLNLIREKIKEEEQQTELFQLFLSFNISQETRYKIEHDIVENWDLLSVPHAASLLCSLDLARVLDPVRLCLQKAFVQHEENTCLKFLSLLRDQNQVSPLETFFSKALSQAEEEIRTCQRVVCRLDTFEDQNELHSPPGIVSIPLQFSRQRALDYQSKNIQFVFKLLPFLQERSLKTLQDALLSFLMISWEADRDFTMDSIQALEPSIWRLPNFAPLATLVIDHCLETMQQQRKQERSSQKSTLQFYTWIQRLYSHLSSKPHSFWQQVLYELSFVCHTQYRALFFQIGAEKFFQNDIVQRRSLWKMSFRVFQAQKNGYLLEMLQNDLFIDECFALDEVDEEMYGSLFYFLKGNLELLPLQKNKVQYFDSFKKGLSLFYRMHDILYPFYPPDREFSSEELTTLATEGCLCFTTGTPIQSFEVHRIQKDIRDGLIVITTKKTPFLETPQGIHQEWISFLLTHSRERGILELSEFLEQAHTPDVWENMYTIINQLIAQKQIVFLKRMLTVTDNLFIPGIDILNWIQVFLKENVYECYSSLIYHFRNACGKEKLCEKLNSWDLIYRLFTSYHGKNINDKIYIGNLIVELGGTFFKSFNERSTNFAIELQIAIIEVRSLQLNEITKETVAENLKRTLLTLKNFYSHPKFVELTHAISFLILGFSLMEPHQGKFFKAFSEGFFKLINKRKNPKGWLSVNTCYTIRKGFIVDIINALEEDHPNKGSLVAVAWTELEALFLDNDFLQHKKELERISNLLKEKATAAGLTLDKVHLPEVGEGLTRVVNVSKLECFEHFLTPPKQQDK